MPPSLRALLVSLLVSALLATAPRARAAGPGASDIPIAPAPTWASRVPLDQATSGGSATGRGGIVEELVDDQVRLGDTVERYRRRVRRITSTAGVESAGQIEIAFDPAYEHLRLHTVSIVRGGQRIDALKRASIRVLEQETSSDERVYNGALTALLVLNDLRVGDTIDLDYTLEGQNPVFDSHFADNEVLSSPRGATHVRVRALFPQGRTISVHTVGIDLAPEERVVDGMRELVWDRRDVAPPTEDDRIPSWFVQFPFVNMSELGTWGEVARWAAPLFDDAEKPAPAITSKAAEIASRASSPEDRALAALRFVQDDVRYLGIEMGANSHRPHDAQAVLEQRFGDCKDKAVLLVALLRALSIEASPALVNTDLGARVASEPPSPFAFDHAIVRVRLGGKDYWVDATRSQERGTLGSSPVRLGRALVVDASTTDLAVIDAPPPTVPQLDTQDSFTFNGTTASLEVITVYRGTEADDMRRRLANTPREQLSKEYLNYYADTYPTIEARAPMDVTDMTKEDVIGTREHYTIKNVLREGGLDVYAGAVRQFVHKPRVTRRTAPLAVDFPVFLRHQIVVKGAWLDPVEEKTLYDDAVDFTLRTDVGENRSTLTFELHSKRDSVPVELVGGHVAFLGTILDATGIALGFREPPQPKGETARKVAWGAGIFGVVGLVIAATALVPKIRRRRWAKKVRPRAGETAALAQEVPTRLAAERVLLAARCVCGSSLEMPREGAWTALVYGGRAVTAGRALCPACGERRVRYFAGGLEE